MLRCVTRFLQMCCRFLQCVAVCVSACVAVHVAVHVAVLLQKKASSKRANTTALYRRGKNEFVIIWSALDKLMFEHRANVLTFFGRTPKVMCTQYRNTRRFKRGHISHPHPGGLC